MTLPHRTMTLLFADIEGSTRLLRRLHDEYVGMLEAHHRILDETLGTYGGVRMGTEGDGSFFTFDSPLEAIAGALDAQHALDAHPWPGGERIRVRIGIHTGEVGVTAEDRPVGLAVHLAARIGALGHGGQTLVSGATKALSEPAPPDIAYLDLGRVALADFPEPVSIHQPYRGAPEPFPPFQTGQRPSVPATVGRFFGREQELDDLAHAVDSDRLVTVLGPGGTGKTRLAIELVRRMAGEGRLAYVADLTAVSNPSRMPSHIGAVLAVAEDPDVGPVTQIAGILGRASALLVLDNCEHLMPDVARFVADVLEADDRARILATSRTPLGMPGERLYDLDPLPVSPRSGAEDAPSVLLFADRASAVAPEFALGPHNLATVTGLVERLDGMPLAIELAASMVRLLPVDELARVLSERIDVLEGSPVLPDRHRSLAAALRWNVESLSVRDREAFDSLGVMTGRFIIDDLAAVAGLSPVVAVQVAASLADHSLVKRQPGARGPTLRMLETIRWFALEALQASGREQAVRRRHLERFHAVAVSARRLRTGDGPAVLDRLWTVRPNLLSAVDHALAGGLHRVALEMTEHLVDMWGIRAAAREARLTSNAVLDAVRGVDPVLELRALVTTIEVRQAVSNGLGPSTAVLERALRLAEATGDDEMMARLGVWSAAAGKRSTESALEDLAALEAGSDWRVVALGLQAIGWVLWWQNRREESYVHFLRLHDRARQVGDPIGMIHGAVGLAASAWTDEEIAASSAISDEVCALAEDLECGWWEGFHLQWRGSHSRRLGHLEESAEWLLRAHRVYLERGSLNQLAFVVANQATLSWLRGDVEGTYEKVLEFADATDRANDDFYNPFVLEMAAAVAAAWDKPEEGARLLGAAEAWRRPGGLTELGMPMPGWDLERHEEVVAMVRSMLPVERVDELWGEGASSDRDDALRLALSLRDRRVTAAVAPPAVT